MADRARRRRTHVTGRKARLPIRLTRGGRFGRGFGELALRADPHFIQRWRPQRACAGKSSGLSEPLVTRRRQCDLACTVCAAKPARRIRPKREPLPPPHAERNRSRLLDRSLPARGPRASGADSARRRPPAWRAEAVGSNPVIWTGGVSRYSLSPRRQPSQSGERAPPRGHQLLGDWRAAFLLRERRRRGRLMRFGGIDVMTATFRLVRDKGRKLMQTSRRQFSAT